MTMTKRQLGGRIGAGALAAAAALTTFTAGAASATTQPNTAGGIATRVDAKGATTTLIASLEGRNEAAGGAPQGQALELVSIHEHTLTYSVAWQNLGRPLQADIHSGPRGADGPVVAQLFAVPGRAGGSAYGTVEVDPAVLSALAAHPGDFYADLHTTAFPAGAARAQFHAVSQASASTVTAVQEWVVLGSQIYACTRQADGTFAFTQHDVDAHLTGGIHHTFVTPDAGPPQWHAPDGSAVTGKVLAKNDNGTGNIAELDLAATQIGAPHGLLADVVEVLRLNTAGGVAPTGPCDPSTTPTIHVPYRADYVFIKA
jgi:hypothetical protein